MLLMYQAVYAAVPVEESIQPAKSAGTTNYQSPVSPELPTPQAAEVSVSGSSLSGLFYQLQLLQQEVQELRGQLEEQQYLLQRLQKGQQDQYLDLDQRLAALAAGQPQPAPQTADSQTAVAATGAALGAATERDAYAQAIEFMRARQFDESIQGFSN